MATAAAREEERSRLASRQADLAAVDARIADLRAAMAAAARPDRSPLRLRRLLPPHSLHSPSFARPKAAVEPFQVNNNLSPKVDPADSGPVKGGGGTLQEPARTQPPAPPEKVASPHFVPHLPMGIGLIDVGRAGDGPAAEGGVALQGRPQGPCPAPAALRGRPQRPPHQATRASPTHRSPHPFCFFGTLRLWFPCGRARPRPPRPRAAPGSGRR